MNHKGNTLVELMITMVLGIILVGAGVYVFVIVKKTLLMQDGLAHVQENARIINAVLGKAIRESGNIGCNAFDGSMVFRVHPPIDPLAYGLTPSAEIQPIFHKGREALWVKTVRPKYVLEETSQGKQGYLIVSGNPKKLKAPKIIALSDCSHVDFFRLEKDSESLGNRYKLTFSELSFSKPFEKGAQVGIFSSKFFYMKDKKIYVEEQGYKPSVLVEEVSDFQFSYKTNYQVEANLLFEGSIQRWWFKWPVKRKEALY